MKTYVEIGACDFDNLDGFLSDNSRVIFVEPIPAYRESLMSKISHDNAIFEECAISSYVGYLEMTYIEPSSATDWWVKGISHASFSSSNLINNNIQRGYNIGKAMTIKVPCLTLDTFILKHNITDIEYLKIDVEGHELEILNNYSWKIKPKQLKIEHKFIDLSRLVNMLSNQGYSVLPQEQDTFAVLQS